MIAYSVNVQLLDELCKRLRTLKRIPAQLKRELVDALLKHVDKLITSADTEHLICIRCAAELRGITTPAMFRMGEKGEVRVYRFCHKEFMDRREIESLPPPGRWPKLGAKHDYRSKPLETYDPEAL